MAERVPHDEDDERRGSEDTEMGETIEQERRYGDLEGGKMSGTWEEGQYGPLEAGRALGG